MRLPRSLMARVVRARRSAAAHRFNLGHAESLPYQSRCLGCPASTHFTPLQGVCWSSTAISHPPTPPATYLSRYFLPTPPPPTASSSKEPAWEVGSADEALQMLIQGGYVRQSSSGVFTFLPLGLKLLRNIENVIQEEMDAIGASRMDMPTLLSDKLWHKSGRIAAIGSQLYRVKDRKGAGFLLAPTHEEEVTKVVGTEVTTYKQLPVKVYQITRKHRDELRPRLGLLRTREFIMKDLYTFDASVDAAKLSYHDVSGAYSRIMRRLFGRDGGVRVAEADSGAMGGSLSHEYHVEDPSGEDRLFRCSSCSYTANAELATSRPEPSAVPVVADDVRVELWSHSQDAVLAGPLTAVVTPRSSETNPVKLTNALHAIHADSEAKRVWPVPSGEMVWDWKDRPEGPMVRFESLKIVMDRSCSGLSPEDVQDAVESSILAFADPSQSPPSDHAAGQPSLSDFFPHGSEVIYHDLRLAGAGESCTRCRTGQLQQSNAIEVGHTFLLGTRYSKALGFTFAAQPNAATGGKQEQHFFQMGCYGLGVTRLLGVLAIKARRAFLDLLAKEAAATSGDGSSGKSKGKPDDTAPPGLLWPTNLCPYSSILILHPSLLSSPSRNETIQSLLLEAAAHSNAPMLIDDRPGDVASIPTKLMQADLVGAQRVSIVSVDKNQAVKVRVVRGSVDGQTGEEGR